MRRAATLIKTLLWTQLLCRLQQLPMQLKKFPQDQLEMWESKPSSCKLIKSFKFDLTGCTQAQGLISIKELDITRVAMVSMPAEAVSLSGISFPDVLQL